jgi:hypothetical protein
MAGGHNIRTTKTHTRTRWRWRLRRGAARERSARRWAQRAPIGTSAGCCDRPLAARAVVPLWLLSAGHAPWCAPAPRAHAPANRGGSGALTRPVRRLSSVLTNAGVQVLGRPERVRVGELGGGCQRLRLRLQLQRRRGGEEGALQVRAGTPAGAAIWGCQALAAAADRCVPASPALGLALSQCGAAARRYMRGSDSDSDSDDGKRVVRSAKARGVGETLFCVC